MLKLVRTILFSNILHYLKFSLENNLLLTNNWSICLDILARYKWAFLQDQTLRQAEKQKFETEVLPNFLNQMLTLFNQEKGPFMTGEEVSYSFYLSVHSFYIHTSINNICKILFWCKLIMSWFCLFTDDMGWYCHC